jgi:hypothetical protein
LGIEEHERAYSIPFEGGKMNQMDLKRISYLIFILIFGLSGARCATPQKELKTYPLTEINLGKVFQENRGLKVLRENATMIHDFYRGGVQEKEEGEGLMKKGKWEEARKHLEESNRYFQVVLKYLPEDEAHRNVYGDQMLIFMPNLLRADNSLKLVTVYKNMGNDKEVAATKRDGMYYLAESLKSVKTEWAYQIKKGLEEEALPKK